MCTNNASGGYTWISVVSGSHIDATSIEDRVLLVSIPGESGRGQNSFAHEDSFGCLILCLILACALRWGEVGLLMHTTVWCVQTTRAPMWSHVQRHGLSRDTPCYAAFSLRPSFVQPHHQVIMLLLGGFAIAGALSKHAIAKQMAVAVLSRVGRRPEVVLLACMFVATFASMWISNVAAPVLCFSLVQPILRWGGPVIDAGIRG